MNTTAAKSSESPPEQRPPFDFRIIIAIIVSGVLFNVAIHFAVRKYRAKRKGPSSPNDTHYFSRLMSMKSLFSIDDRILGDLEAAHPPLVKEDIRSQTVRVIKRSSILRRFTKPRLSPTIWRAMHAEVQTKINSFMELLSEHIKESIAFAGYGDTEGYLFSKNTGIQIEGDAALRSKADSTFLVHLLQETLVCKVLKRFNAENLQKYVNEAKDCGILETTCELVYDDDAWTKLAEVFVSGKYKKCHVLSDAVSQLIFRITETIEMILSEAFDHTILLKDLEPEIECIILAYLELYMGCMSTNPYISFTIPEKGAKIDEFKMSRHELSRSDAKLVLFTVSFGISNGQNVVIKPIVMCL